MTTFEKNSLKTIEEFVIQSNIHNITSESESDLCCVYSDEYKIYPTSLSKDSKMCDLMSATDPAIIFTTKDMERKAFIDGLKLVNAEIKMLKEDNKMMKEELSSLKDDVLYPLIIRELLKQSR